jgi:hypothetical protein
MEFLVDVHINAKNVPLPPSEFLHLEFGLLLRARGNKSIARILHYWPPRSHFLNFLFLLTRGIGFNHNARIFLPLGIDKLVLNESGFSERVVGFLSKMVFITKGAYTGSSSWYDHTIHFSMDEDHHIDGLNFGFIVRAKYLMRVGHEIHETSGVSTQICSILGNV